MCHDGKGLVMYVLCYVVQEACDSWPCKNGGDCENHERGYKCKCKGHMFGSNCEICITVLFVVNNIKKPLSK